MKYQPSKVERNPFKLIKSCVPANGEVNLYNIRNFTIEPHKLPLPLITLSMIQGRDLFWFYMDKSDFNKDYEILKAMWEKLYH
jgi:hypothetical protein